jgi:hypothetical protein
VRRFGVALQLHFDAGISLILHGYREIRCNITTNTARCIIGTPTTDPWGIWSPRKKRKKKEKI